MTDPGKLDPDGPEARQWAADVRSVVDVGCNPPGYVPSLEFDWAPSPEELDGPEFPSETEPEAGS